jgi:hypothetical protein
MGRVLRIVAPTIDRKPKHGQRNLKGLKLAIPDTDAVEQANRASHAWRRTTLALRRSLSHQYRLAA